MSTSSPKNAVEQVLDEIAADSGLAVVVVDRNSKVVASSNDNSICRALNPPENFVGPCAEDCGRAFARTREAGTAIDYECHAGLQCRAVPLGGKQLIAITGRTFIKTSSYRKATARAISGDWRSFAPTRIFGNVLLSDSTSQLDRPEQRIGELDPKLFTDAARQARSTTAKDGEHASNAADAGRKTPDPFESSLLNYKLDRPAAETEGRPDPFE